MASPVPVAAFKAVTSKREDPIRVRIVKLVKFMILFYRWYKYAYDSSGRFTGEFSADLCNVPCNKTPTV